MQGESRHIVTLFVSAKEFDIWLELSKKHGICFADLTEDQRFLIVKLLAAVRPK